MLQTHITEYSLHRRMKASISLPDSPLLPPSPHRVAEHSVLTTGVTDLTENIITERTPLLDPKVNGSPGKEPESPSVRSANKTRLVIAVSYASFSGILSGMCLLFAKSGTELLLLTLAGDNQFWRWQSWILVLALVAFALLQLGYLHKALVLANPTLVCPCMSPYPLKHMCGLLILSIAAFCFYNLSSIVNGLVYFDQFSLIPPLHLGLVVLGIVVLLGGVWVVSIQSSDDAVDAEDSDEELAMEDTGFTESPTSTHTQDLEWGTRSEPPMSPTERTSSIGLALDLGGEHVLPPQSTISLSQSSEFPLSPRSPTLTARRRPGFHHGERSSSIRRHQRVPSSTIQLSPPPLHSRNAVSTLAGGGFQIGLSASSPGFSIVPLERRRRVSALGSGHVNSAAVDEVPGQAGSRRRTVSEGDMGMGRSDGNSAEGPDASPGGDVAASLVGRGGRSLSQWMGRILGRG